MDFSDNAISAGSILANIFIFIIGQRSVVKQIGKSAKVAREESDRLIKRESYAGFMAAMEELCEAKASKDKSRLLEAEKQINYCLAQIDLVAPKAVYLPASNVMKFAPLPRKNKKRDKFLNTLYTAFRKDLDVNEPEYELRPSI